MNRTTGPSYDDLLALANHVALGNTEYDALSNLAVKLIEGGEYEIGARDDADDLTNNRVQSVRGR